MWVRDLLFFGLGLSGLAALSAGLLSAQRVAPAIEYRAALPAPTLQHTLAELNQAFQHHWQAHPLTPAPRADDLLIARRLSLALTGTIPSFEEIRALEAQPASERLHWWVSRLLDDRRYADYVAERFARAFVGTEEGPFLIYRRRRFVSWLSDQLQQNTPYDQIVRQLISGTGLWTDSPGVNFLTATVMEDSDGRTDPIRLAARTSRAFLGMRIDCLQCHDDYLGNVVLGDAESPREGQQTDFHQLAAFYSQANTSLLGVKDDKQTYQYKYLDAEEEAEVPAVVPFGTELLTAEGNRRQQLARWVTHPQNKPFARASINRIWALMLGRPLVEPIDDIPLYGDYPPGLQTLADGFVNSGYDLRWLIRVIAASEVFQRDSRAAFDVTSEHERHWAVFPLSRLRPEQAAGSLIQASSLKTIDSGAPIIKQLGRFAQQYEFIVRYGDLGEDEFDDRGGTVAQRLLMMNGELTRKRTEHNPLLNAASRIALLSPSDAKAIETAYLCILTRRPTETEQSHFLERFEQQADRAQSVEDLYWILLNSTEFSWNH